jgi:ABC-2 type transport system ATP-binding protein/lipopolysaccharide transport system ATP-binding protein
MSELAIEVQGVGKRYRLGSDRAAYGTLRDSLTALVARRRGRVRAEREVWALRDVDLTVGTGEAIGIVGSNGAGKTTLLRILARITEPSVGVARTRGRVGALLEVGTGFHPELSGRDNVFLSGAVMGMTRTEIRGRYDEIVEFAGVTEFLDTPLKRYSSGMRLRLAFAVAAHLEPELMLVDEILAVGDVEFQRRCLTRMGQLSREGRTVVFISHDLGAVTRLCPRAVWIDHGGVVRDGESTDVVQEYYAAVVEHAGEVELDVEGDVGIRRISLTDEDGNAVQRAQRGDPLGVTVTVVVRRPVPGLDLAVYLLAADGSRIVDESWSEQEGFPALAAEPGEYAVRMVVPPLLRAGDYVVGVWLGTEHADYHQSEALGLAVVPRADDRQAALTRPRLVQPAVQWSSRRLTATP